MLLEDTKGSTSKTGKLKPAKEVKASKESAEDADEDDDEQKLFQRMLVEYSDIPGLAPERRWGQRLKARSTRGRNPAEDPWGYLLQDLGRYPLLDGLPEETALSDKVQAGFRAFQDLLSNPDHPDRVQSEKLVAEAVRAYHSFFEANLRLVIHWVSRTQLPKDMDMIDLFSMGAEGLERAIVKFDPEKGFKFSTYASWWIRQKIARGIANESRQVRLPVHVHTAMKSYGMFVKEFRAVTGAEPTTEELETAGFKPSFLKRMRMFGGEESLIRLDAPLSPESASTYGDLVPSKTSVGASEFSRYAYHEELENVMSKLDLEPRELALISLRYGAYISGAQQYFEQIDGSPGRYFDLLSQSRESGGLTLEQCGDLTNLTRERVRQLIGEALDDFVTRHCVNMLGELCNFDEDEAEAAIQHFIHGVGKPGPNTTEKYEAQVRPMLEVVNLCYRDRIIDILPAVITKANSRSREAYMSSLFARFGLVKFFNPSRSQMVKKYNISTTLLASFEREILVKLTGYERPVELFSDDSFDKV